MSDIETYLLDEGEESMIQNGSLHLSCLEDHHIQTQAAILKELETVKRVSKSNLVMYILTHFDFFTASFFGGTTEKCLTYLGS